MNDTPTSGGTVERHEYQRDAASGAGNCWCGRPETSALHPHRFTPALSDPMRCVCRRPPNSNIHRAQSGRSPEP